MENITSYSDINTKLINNSKSILLLYKSGHLESECAYLNIELVFKNVKSVSAFAADVNTVIDIHPNYGITRVPSLLLFDKGDLKNAINGCQNRKSIKSILNKTFSPKKTILK